MAPEVVLPECVVPVSPVPTGPATNWSMNDMVKVCRKHVGGWRGLSTSDIVVDKLGGGMTNHLYRVSASDETRAPRAVLLRLFGTETSVCRVKDNLIFKALSDHGLGPQFYGAFEGGRIEEFLENCRPLTNAEMKKPHHVAEVGRQLARVHDLNLPLDREEPQLFRDSKMLIGTSDKLMRSILPESPEHYVNLLQQITEKTPSPIKFCHNDLQEGNIMVSTETDELTLIDFEYGGYNFAYFDIANYFAEYAFAYDDTSSDLTFELVKREYPSHKQMVHFLEEYSRVSGGSEPEDMVDDVRQYMLTSHLYWGLWAAGMSTRGAGYKRYMDVRLAEYERMAEELVR
mmetsp:Transcript_10318/g.31557  ORF Transcript_10318/g.31557 Transcript_10318/m.31557 type:complete len:344 (-) Transcript_10318:2451-3482(-)